MNTIPFYCMGVLNFLLQPLFWAISVYVFFVSVGGTRRHHFAGACVSGVTFLLWMAFVKWTLAQASFSYRMAEMPAPSNLCTFEISGIDWLKYFLPAFVGFFIGAWVFQKALTATQTQTANKISATSEPDPDAVSSAPQS